MADSTESLLQHFVTLGSERLSFLERDFSLVHGCGLSDSRFPDPALRPIDFARLPWPFSAVHRYWGTRLHVDIAYSVERESEINAIVHLHESRTRVALWELYQAAGLSSDGMAGGGGVRTCEHMSRVLTALASSLRQHSALFLPPSDELMAAALRLREQRLFEHQSQIRHSQMETAITAAADAFRAGSFGKVIAELQPYEDILPPAQRTKLDIARRRSTSP